MLWNCARTRIGASKPGHLDRGLTSATDRSLPVPHQRLRDPAPALDYLPHPRKQIAALPRGKHHRRNQPREPERHHQDRQHPVLARPDRYPRFREPQIALGDLPRLIRDSIGRIDCGSPRNRGGLLYAASGSVSAVFS